MLGPGLNRCECAEMFSMSALTCAMSGQELRCGVHACGCHSTALGAALHWHNAQRAHLRITAYTTERTDVDGASSVRTCSSDPHELASCEEGRAGAQLSSGVAFRIGTHLRAGCLMQWHIDKLAQQLCCAKAKKARCRPFKCVVPPAFPTSQAVGGGGTIQCSAQTNFKR